MSSATRLSIHLCFVLLLGAPSALAVPPDDLTDVGQWIAGFCDDAAEEGGVLAAVNGRVVDIYDAATPGQHDLLKRLGAGIYGASQVFISGGHLHVAEYDGGLEIYDLADPAAPVHLGTSPALTYVLDGEIVGPHGYFVDDFDDLVILDLSDPTAPVEVGRLSFAALESIYSLAVAGDVIYIGGQYNLYAVDASDRANPVRTDDLPIGGVRGIELEAGNAFVNGLSGGVDGVYSLDLASPLHPTILGSFPAPGAGHYFRSLNLDGDLAFVTSNVDTLWVLDVGDPASMVDLAQLDAPGYGGGNSMFQSLDRLWIRDFYLGVFELDVAAPLQPVLTDRFHARSTGINFAHDGGIVFAAGVGDLTILDWSDQASPALLAQVPAAGLIEYIQLADGVLYAADEGHGVRILDVSQPAQPQEIGLIPGDPGPLALLGPDRLAVIEGSLALRIHDVSDPAAPGLLSETIFATGLRAVAAQSDRIYLGSDDLIILDASDPSSPVVDGIFDQGTFVDDVAVHGDHAYLTAFSDGVNIVSVSDPAAPFLVANWTENLSPDINLVLRFDLEYPLLHVASLFFGPIVVDVSDPANPQTLAGLKFGGLDVWGAGSAGPNTTLIGLSDGYHLLRHDFALASTPRTLPAAPGAARLLGVHPNPFNPSASVAFDLPAREAVTLRVFDLQGRLVRSVLEGEIRERGRHSAVWDGRDAAGRPAASGTYVFRLEAGRSRQTLRAALVK